MFQSLGSRNSDYKSVVAIKTSAPAPLSGVQLYDSIYARLDKDLPTGPYIADSVFAGLMGLSRKTLRNRRTLADHGYPIPLKIANCRDGKHVRAEIVDWMAKQELAARTTIVHRCH